MIYTSVNDSFTYMIVDGQYPVFKIRTFKPQDANDKNLTGVAFRSFLDTVSYHLFFAFGFFLRLRFELGSRVTVRFRARVRVRRVRVRVRVRVTSG